MTVQVGGPDAAVVHNPFHAVRPSVPARWADGRINATVRGAWSTHAPGWATWSNESSTTHRGR
jgi:hypothetical protein